MNLSEFYNCNGGSLAEVTSRLPREDRLRKYLAQFSASDEYAAFLDSLSSGDYPAAFRNIHSIKGMSANLGLLDIQCRASEICELLRPLVKPDCDMTPLLTSLESAFCRFRESFSQLEE